MKNYGVCGADNVAPLTEDARKGFFDEWRADAAFERYEKLKRLMIADRLGFCRECYGALENSSYENGESRDHL